MDTSITGPFAHVLKTNRAQFNAQFADARRARPKLDPTAFADHLRATVTPIVNAVHDASPAQTNEVAQLLFTLSLDLLGQELIGANSRYPHITDGWRMLLPALPQHVAASPRQVVGAVTNALYNLSLTPNARPLGWIQALQAFAPMCPDVPTLLQVGQVVAWRAGLAHYRPGALAVCQKLDDKLARAVLGIVDATNSVPMDRILDRLAADPWLSPASIKSKANSHRELQIVARVGAFRGFGGLFMSP
ncbi:MAG: hypothetical protein ABI874_09750, partial [Chloroflexota bacterium]